MNSDIRVNPCPRKWCRPLAHSPTCRPASDRRGIALIIALGLLVLVTAMFLGYTASMKSQRFQARNYNDAMQARMLAMSAVDRAMALIGTNAPVRDNSNTWHSGPGMINKNAGTAEKLYSNVIVTGDRLANVSRGGVPTGLNQQTTSGDYDIIPNIGSIYTDAKLDIGWINVGKDPTQGVSASNPLAARYAFWIDDEAAKVNLNYAYLRSLITASNLYSTHLVGLDALYKVSDGTTWGAPEVTGIASAVYATDPPPNTGSLSTQEPSRPLETLQEMQRASGISSGIYGWNKFFTTVYSWDDNKDAFGQLRIDPTGLTTADIAVNTTNTNNLYGRLRNYDWSKLGFAGAGNNFESKYTSTNLQQIIANILAWNQVPGTNLAPHDILTATGLPTTYLGVQKVPLINEVGADAAFIASGTLWAAQVRVRVELVNPFGFPVPVTYSGAPTSYTIVPEVASVSIITTDGVGMIITSTTFGSSSTNEILTPVTAAAVAANNYFIVNPTVYFQISGTCTTAPTALTLNFKLNKVRLVAANVSTLPLTSSQADLLVDYVPGTVFTNGWALVANNNGTSFTGTFGAAQSIGRNDPRVAADIASNYVLQATADVLNGDVNTNAPPKSAWPTTVLLAGGTGVADTETSVLGIYSTVTSAPVVLDSLSVAADKMKMKSIGEIGYISTGVPWRTIRLQPTKVGGTTGPAPADWAMLDLFRIPDIENVQYNDGSVIAACGTNQNDSQCHRLKGRININQHIWPDGTLNAATVGPSNISGSVAPIPFRSRPLVALLKGWADPNKYDQPTPAAGHLDYDIYNYTSIFGYPGFDTIGEICEVSSLQYGASSGGSPQNDAQQEEVIRGIANLITTRSNVFTVWAVAQTIQDVDKDGAFTAGQDIITAEQKIMAVIERYEDTAGKVRFRIKYLKYLTE